MKFLKIKFWASVLIAFILGWGLCYFLSTKTVRIEDKSKGWNQTVSTSSYDKKEVPNPSANLDVKIPSYALEILEYVLENNEAPSGYIGGRVFENREGLLPKKSSQGDEIQYREWDVYPRKDRHHRGAERLVTSNKGAAYFTSNHYQSFKKIK